VPVHSSTQFRRSGQRDDRRRRLLADEYPGAAGGGTLVRPGAEGLLPRRSENYGDAEFMDEQLRLIDLVPRRLPIFGLLLLGGLTVVAGLEALYAWMPDLAPLTTDGRVAALDLDGEGSLAVWFSSVTLLLAAVAAVLVYAIRRYKTDDYRGNYRIWLWAAMCWVVMSIDETSSLHEGFKEMMAYVTGTRLFGDGSIWWAIPYFFLLGAVGSRLLVDMHHCRLSSAALLATAACYAVAVAAQFGWLLPESGARGVMLEEGAEMVGNLMLLAAMGLHARYVILDAEGLLPRRELEGDHLGDELKAEAGYSPAAQRWLSVDQPHKTPRPARKRKRRTVEPEPEPVARKLTKAEKKALRKRLMSERLQRERAQRSKWSG